MHHATLLIHALAALRHPHPLGSQWDVLRPIARLAGSQWDGLRAVLVRR